MEKLFENVPGGWTKDRESWLQSAMKQLNLPREAFEVVRSGDEYSGRRFGEARCRKGFAFKLGGGGRNRKSKVSAYQVWAVVKSEFRK